MEINICAATEVSDSCFQFSRNSIYSFIKTNPWFTGTIFLLTHKEAKLSVTNYKQLESIYSKLEIIDLTKDNRFNRLVSKFSTKTTDLSSIVLTYLKLAVFDIKVDGILYFSNTSLFLKDISSILTPNSISFCVDSDEFPITVNLFNINPSIFYASSVNLNSVHYATLLDASFNSNEVSPTSCNHILNLYKSNFTNLKILTNSIVAKSSNFSDRKYFQLRKYIQSLSAISYSTSLDSKQHFRIQQLWLYHNKGVGLFLERPTSHNVELVNLSSKVKLKYELSEIDKFISEARQHEPNYIYALDKIKLDHSIKEFSKILENKILDSPISTNFSTACVIAFSGRHKIVELNVRLLCEQTLVPAIILVVSSLGDSMFADELRKKYNNVFIVHHQNYPIGGKWNVGVKYAQKLKVNGVMILGSDDLLSLDYFKTCYDAIDEGRGSSGNGVDLIGNRSWMIYDLSKKLYKLEYKPSVPIFLGGGKMFSKNFLDSVDWEIFRKYRPFHLDEYGYDLVKQFSNSIKLIDQSNFILSIKGKWDVINSTSDILKASNRITAIDITKDASIILNSIKIKNHETLDGTLI